jgi:N utilization substance protein B
MGKTRSELRDIIVRVLYETYILDNAKVKYDIMEVIKENLEIENDFVKEIVFGVKDNQTRISEIANTYLVDWEIDRLSKVDKAILSVGIYELKYTKTPSIVAINEAIELANKYSDPKVSKMINACLDKIYHEEIEKDEE